MSALELPLLLKATDSVLGWFGLLRKEQKERKEQERKAIEALYMALNETLTYFRRLEHPELAPPDAPSEAQRNLKAEDAISRLWMKAAVELKDIAPELSQRCFMKGVYWTDRDQWNDQRVRSANIKLEELLEEAKSLLA